MKSLMIFPLCLLTMLLFSVQASTQCNNTFAGIGCGNGGYQWSFSSTPGQALTDLFTVNGKCIR